MKKSIKYFWLFFATILSLPLFFTPFTAFPWLFGKTIFFHITVELLMLFFFIFCIKTGKVELRKLSSLDYSILFFLGALLLTSFTGENFSHSFFPNQARSIGVFTWIHFGLWYFLLKQTIKEEKVWLKLMKFSIIIGSIIGLTAVFQNNLPMSWRGDIGDRFSGILGNPAFFGSYILLQYGIAIYIFFIDKTKKRFIYLIAAVFFGICILLSGVRGEFLALIASIVVGGIGLLFAGENTLKKKIFKVSMVSSILCCIVLLIVLAQKTSFGDVFPALRRLANYSISSGTGDTRIMAWNIAVEGFKERPIFGWGWGNYDITFNKYYNPKFLQYSFQETVWDKPHNGFLEMLNALGVFAFTYISIFILASVSLFRKWKQLTLERKKENIILFSIVVGYILQLSLLFDTFNVLTSFTFILAFISWKSSVYKSDDELSYNNFSFGKKIIYSLSLGAIVLMMLHHNIQILRASHFLDVALGQGQLYTWNTSVIKALEKPISFQDESAILLADKLTKFEKANQLAKENKEYWKDSAMRITSVLEEYIVKYPTNISYPVWASQVYIILGQFHDEQYYGRAAQLLQEAHRISPQKQEVMFLLGRTYLLQKDFIHAIEIHKKAVEVEPNVSLSHWFLALAQIASGDIKSGLGSIEMAFTKGFTPSVENRLYIIDLYAKEQQYSNVVEHYKILLQDDSENVNWYIKLATAYALAGDKKMALETVHKAVLLYPPLEADAEKFIQEYKLQ